MNRKLLQEAADIIGAIPKKQLDLDSWVDEDTIDADPGSCELKKKNANCGTIACAGGWLALTPKFRRLGLKLVKDEFYNHYSLYHVNKDGVKTYGYEGLAKVFGITEYDASALFSSRNHGSYDMQIINRDTRSNISDRRLFKERVKKLLKEIN